MLPPDLAAKCAQVLSVEDKYHLLASAQGAQFMLSQPSAWEPSVLGNFVFHGLLRRVRRRGVSRSLALLGLWGVHELHVDVGDMDINVVPDEEKWIHSVLPLEEFLGDLLPKFSQVRQLRLSNVSDLEVDINSHFLTLRCNLLADFEHVRLRPTWLAPPGNYSCHRAKYSLLAARGFGRGGSELAIANPGDCKSVDGSDPIGTNVEDDAFVEEHMAIYQGCDGQFHVKHAPQRTFAQDEVQRQYAKLLATPSGSSKSTSERARSAIGNA